MYACTRVSSDGDWPAPEAADAAAAGSIACSAGPTALAIIGATNTEPATGSTTSPKVASGRRARPFLVGLLAPGSSGSICSLLTVAIAAPVASTPPEARETGLSFVLF